MNDTHTLYLSFARLAAAAGARVAVRAGERAWTFAELDAASSRLAASLGRAGLADGSLVGLLLPSRPGFLAAFLALCRKSCRVALISPKYAAAEIAHIAARLRPAALLALEPTVRGVAGECALEMTPLPAAGPGEEPLFLACPPGASANGDAESARVAELVSRAALLKLTSGSTGESKAVALSLENLLAEAATVCHTLAITEADRIVTVSPLFHSYAFDLGLLPLLVTGASLSLHETLVPRRLLAELAQRESTIFLGVPAAYRVLLEAEAPGVASLAHLRYALSCTAPLPPRTVASFAASFGVPICDHYGSSETGAITTHVPAQVLARPTSVGRPMRGVEVRMLDDAGHPAGPGGSGEVVIRSGAVALGYAMGGPAGRAPFAADGYHTGDVGTLDADGFLHLQGRLDDTINVGGLKVSPREVQQVLEIHPAVREAVVIGVCDAAGETIVFAAVTLSSPAEEGDLIAHCRARLAEHKAPRRIEVRRELPRGPTGKVQLRPEDVRL